MADKRDNCIILLVDSPVPENVHPELREAFGAERSVHINLDLLQNSYRLAKNFKDAILIMSYENSPRHPDLTWLDPDDPGFLEAKTKNLSGRISDAFQLAFNTGAKKALIINHLSPAIKQDWLYQTFDSVSDKTLALGLNQDGSAHIVGLTLANLKLLDGISFTSSKTAEELTEKAKRNKLSIFSLPESYAVKNEENLRKWLDSKEPAPTLFSRDASTALPISTAAALSTSDEKKHSRRTHKSHVHTQETNPEQKTF